MNKILITRPPLESLACVNPDCELYGQPGADNLIVRKTYGQHQTIRFLRCRHCREEFSERKNTALWNCKIPEQKAVSVCEHLSEGSSIKGTARLVRVDPGTVRRLNKRSGQHGQQFHDQHAEDLPIQTLQGDERHGFARSKAQPVWEAELIDPYSKFVISHVQGRRDETLLRRLLADGAARLADRHQVALFTDGDAGYAALFPEYFGQPYQPPRQPGRGRPYGIRYRIPRTAAHVQIVKHRQGARLQELEIRYTHGTQKRIRQALDELGYRVPNTSCIERRNGTARSMNKAQVRKTLAFAKRPAEKLRLGWWTLTVYNWCRSHRSLRERLPEPEGKKSTPNGLRPWPWDWPIQL